MLKLYVGNLAYALTEEELEDAFARFAPTKVIIIRDPADGMAKGYGFVEFGTREQCETALKAMDGYELLNRNLRVAEAKGPRRQ